MQLTIDYLPLIIAHWPRIVWGQACVCAGARVLLFRWFGLKMPPCKRGEISV